MKSKILCEICGSDDIRMQVQATISAPAELNHLFSKSNLRRKDVYLLGVNWETGDFLCSNCGHIVIEGYGNYVSRLEKEVKELRKKLQIIGNIK